MNKPASGFDDLFFAELVRGYVEENPRFIRRDWLAEELEAKLREPGKRFVLITAEPGAGKSVFMAQLAHDSHDHCGWLRYFIRRDQRSVLSDVSDKSLLLRIGYQLAALHPELFSQKQLRLSVAQRIGKVAEQGEAVGAEIKRLTASPFYQKILQIEQQVQTNQGKVIGLRVEELVIETRLLSVEDFLHLALIDPARALERIDAKRQIVVLIDALDEISYHPTIENIRTWLTNCPQLPENIRFVLTSRPPDEALKLFCDKQAPRLSQLTIAKEDRKVKEDIKRFLKGLVAEPALAQAFQEAEGGAPAFAKKAADKAHGNLGYVDALARGIDQALAHKDARTLNALLSLKELPTDLEGLYAFFLRQVRASVEKQSVEVEDAQDVHYLPAWPAVYKRVLAVLAVAREPQSIAQIKRLGGTAANEDYLEHAVNQLLQFVQIVDGHLRFYHATVAEFLISPETRDNSETAVFYVDPVQWHGRIANYYWKTGHGTWANCDAYGLNHLATHLFEGQQQERLQQLISKNWMKAKFAVFHSQYSFIADVNLALKTAKLASPPNIVQQIRCCFIAATIGSLVANVRLEALVILVRCGEGGLALEYAGQIQDLEKQYKAYLQIANAIVDAGIAESTKENVSAILDLAMNTAVLMSDLAKKVRAYIEIAVVLLRIGDSTGLIRAFEMSLTQEDEHKKANALLEIFPLLIQSDCHNEVLQSTESALGFCEASAKSRTSREMAEVLLQLEGKQRIIYNPLASTLVCSSLEATLVNEREHLKASELGKLFKILLQVENRDGFSQAMDALLAIKDQQNKYYQIDRLLDALVLQNDRKGLQNVLATVQAFRDSWEKANSLLNIFKAFSQINDREAMLEVLDAVLGMADAYRESQVLGEMAHILAQLEDLAGLDKIRQEAESWDDRGCKVNVLIEVAEAMRAAEMADASKIAALALEAATSMTDSSWPLNAFKKLFAMASREVGDEDWLSKVEAAVKGIDNKYSKGDRIAQLAEAYAEADNPKKAFFFANYILDNQLHSESMGSALPKVARALIQHEGLDALDKFLQQLADNAWLGDWILVEIAKELSKEKDEAHLIRALQIAQSLSKEVSTAELLNELVYLLTETGMKARAIEVARQSFSIMLDIFAEPNSSYGEERKVKALSDSALALVHVGEREYLELGKNSVESYDHGQRKEQALLGISIAMAEAGMKDEAIASTILSIAASEKIKDERNVSSAMGHMAHLLSKLGRHEEAEQVAHLSPVARAPYAWMNPTSTNSDEIKAAVEARDLDKLILIYDEVIRHKYLWFLDDIAGALAQFKHQEERLEEILTVVQNHKDWQKELVLPNIAEALIVAGMRDMARKVIHDTLSRSFRILIEEDDKAQVFIKSVNLLVRLGDRKKLLEAVSSLRGLRDYCFKAQMLGELSRALWSADMVSESHKVSDLALRTARLSRKPSSKALAFGQLALVMVHIGMLAEASETINAGLKIVREELEDDLQKSLALCELAGALAALEKPYDLEQARNMVDDIHNQAHKLTALNGFVKAFTEIESSKALDLALEAFQTSRLVGREAFFETLQTGSIALSTIDKGETLWHIFQEMMAVEDWWGDEYR